MKRILLYAALFTYANVVAMDGQKDNAGMYTTVALENQQELKRAYELQLEELKSKQEEVLLPSLEREKKYFDFSYDKRWVLRDSTRTLLLHKRVNRHRIIKKISDSMITSTHPSPSYLVPLNEDGTCKSLRDAILADNHAEVDRFLKDPKTDLRAGDEYGDTAMHYAVALKRKVIMRLLVLAGAAHDIVAPDNITAWQLAHYDQQKEILEGQSMRREKDEERERTEKSQERDSEIARLQAEVSRLKRKYEPEEPK